jgi:TatD DNase family protein
MIIDTHCHYNLDPLHPNWQTHWQKAQQNGVIKSIVVGTDLDSNYAAQAIASTESNLFTAVGNHPNYYSRKFAEQLRSGSSLDNVLKDIAADVEKLSQLLPHQKAVAIGETGLDFFRLEPELTTASITVQKKALQLHIQLAQQHQLPLILHVRDKKDDAYFAVLEMLHQNKFVQPFVLHCVSGPMNYVQQAIEMGGYIGIAGNVTYKNAEHIRDLVRSVPQDRLLSETDAPFLPPQEFRGETCEPWMISKTVDFIESELHISRNQLQQNAEKLFGI